MSRPVDHGLIQRVVRRVRARYRDLVGGNCGVFAIALCKWLKSEKHPCELVFIGDNETGNYNRGTLYHVVVGVDGKYYDGGGMIGGREDVLRYVDEVIAPRYGDPRPCLHVASFRRDLAAEAKANTDYSVPEKELRAAVIEAAERGN